MPPPRDPRPHEDPEPVSPFDRRVYDGFGVYVWDEAECWPSQATVARDLGCARESVNRAVRRLTAAGWLRVKERRWSPRSGWCHNVYELLAPWRPVGAPTVKRIVRRAHNALWRRRNRLDSGAGHTNTEWRGEELRRCGCRWCRWDVPSVRPPPRLASPLEMRIEKIMVAATSGVPWAG